MQTPLGARLFDVAYGVIVAASALLDCFGREWEFNERFAG